MNHCIYVIIMLNKKWKALFLSKIERKGLVIEFRDDIFVINAHEKRFDNFELP